MFASCVTVIDCVSNDLMETTLFALHPASMVPWYTQRVPEPVTTLLDNTPKIEWSTMCCSREYIYDFTHADTPVTFDPVYESVFVQLTPSFVITTVSTAPAGPPRVRTTE